VEFRVAVLGDIVNRGSQQMLEDSSPEMREAYYRRLAEMSPEEKVNIGVALHRAGDALQRAGLRLKHPEADEDEITFRLAVARFGEDLARRAYGRDLERYR